MKNLFIFTFALLISLGNLWSQTTTQSIRGTVLDKDTRQPLIGATVIVADLGPFTGAITDYDGTFIIEKVPVGRHSIECSYIGYTSWQSDGLVLTSARELVLEIELKEGSISLIGVVVTAIARPKEAMNDAAVLSARSFSVEEVQHFAGAINDPGRMAHSLPGVQPSKDNEGDLVIRGNASSGVLWRLEGVDILNPNHFARLGGSGGGLTIFSVSVLSNSDFFSGAFPSEYGNALAGVFDMRFRNGNQDKRQHTFRAGMLGLEFATEGPFSGTDKGQSGNMGKSGSYLMNYRYSTLGILNELGLYLVGDRVRNNFQDLSFNLYFPGKTGKSSIRVWGTGGLSFEEKITSEEKWRVFDDSVSYESGSDVGIIGVTHTLTTGKKSHLKTTVAGMAQRAFYSRKLHDAADATTFLLDENYVQGKLALSTFFTQKMSLRTTFKTGLQLSNLFYDLKYDTIQPTGGVFGLIGEEGSAVQVQPFAQISYRPTARMTLNFGLHAMYAGLTEDFAIEPRLSGRLELKDTSQYLSMAVGLHSQTVPLGVYFARVEENGSVTQPNLGLELMKSAQVILAYDNLLSNQLRLHAEVYVQRLYNIPVDASNGRAFWLLNEIEGYSIRRMESKGRGLNAGLDISLEKFFRKGLFFILTGSLFDSKYDVGGSEQYNTQFNANYMAALTFGKEWSFKNSGTLQLGVKMLYLNGLPSTPLAAVQPYPERPVYDESRPYSDRAPDYFRPDLRLAWRKGRTSLSLDVQNVLNIENKRAFGWAYNREQEQWLRRNQAGLIPVLGFRVDF